MLLTTSSDRRVTVSSEEGGSVKSIPRLNWETVAESHPGATPRLVVLARPRRWFRNHRPRQHHSTT
eukprot:1009746-Pyramimonas_sp.AAC.1